MQNGGEMGTGATWDEGAELRAYVESLRFANKSLMHELAAVKLEKARLRAELELAEQRAAGLEQERAADSIAVAGQRSVASRLERQLGATKRVVAAAALAGVALACRRALLRRTSGGKRAFVRRFSGAL